MTRDEMEELKGLAASMGLYDDKNPCKRAVILGKAIKALEQQTCEDAVSREAAVDAANKVIERDTSGNNDVVNAMIAWSAYIKSLPSVNPQPKTGHWIEQIDHEENCRTLICSNCDRPALHDEDSIWKHKFCPHCGAKMVEPQESEVEE